MLADLEFVLDMLTEDNPYAAMDKIKFLIDQATPPWLPRPHGTIDE